MVSGAWCSGLSLLSSLKLIGWKAKRIGLSEETGTAGLAAVAGSDCGRAGLGAPTNANKIPNNRLRELQLIMMEAALWPHSILLRQLLLTRNRKVRIAVSGGRARLTSADG